MALPNFTQSAGSNPFAGGAPPAPAPKAAAPDSSDPGAIVSKIEDLLDQLKAALGVSDGDSDTGMAPQTDDEIVAGLAPKPKSAGLPSFGGR
jgi:hypothetical protein